MNAQSWVRKLSLEKKKVPENADLKEKIVTMDCSAKAAIQDVWRCDGTIENLQTIHENARRKINELRAAIQDFETAAQEADDVKQKLEMEESVKFFKEQIQNTNSTLRKAYLTKKIALDEESKMLLLGGAKNSEVRRRQASAANQENLARTANDVTQSLLSISRVMSGSVQQSADSLNTLVRSSGSLKQTDEELKDQSGVIQTSHRLLTKYNRRECTDKFLIFLALAFFFSTVLYILKKRLWPV
ncbi:vesicle transport protein SEC20-like [Styela clava]|uniref:vesicle transport protein SEC20-like n=1 Tax=Styela clava TaxID=7725 RepID=UPI00193ACA5A|nr:vesicle transport protein SEC20-like [Styela clava]